MKFKTYTVSLILLILLALSNFSLGISHNTHEIERLLEVANSTGGDILGYSINGYIKMEQISREQILSIARELGYERTLTQNNDYVLDGFRHTVLDWYLGNNYYKLNVSFQEGTSFVSVSVDTSNDSNPTVLYDRVKEILNNYNGSVHITTSIYMELDADLTLVEVVEKVYGGFNRLSANLVSDYEDENGAFGFIGYSPYLKNTIEIEGKKYNLHMAVNYNDFSGKYHLVISNPIIESSY